jgi:hypothetical protein
VFDTLCDTWLNSAAGAKESTGFLFNRGRAMKKECLHLADNGVASTKIWIAPG